LSGHDRMQVMRRGLSRFLRTHPTHPLRGVATFIRHERAYARNGGISDWAETLRSGFLTRSRQMYDFARHGSDLYLSDYARLTRTAHVNGSWAEYLDDKLCFHVLFDEHLRLPRLFGVFADGRFAALHGGVGDIFDLLSLQGRLVIKARRGSFGRKVYMVRQEAGGGIAVNGIRLRPDERLHDRIAEGSDYVVTEFVEQARYASRIYPATPNTVRLLTLLDPEGSGPFIAAAVHRFGGHGSGPIDNFSCGGLSAEVDIFTGKLGPAARFSREGVEWHSRHPDTDESVEDVQIPGWQNLRDTLLAEVARLKIPYVGWDVIVTDNGFRVIEGNSHSGMHVFQVHRPLLVDPRTRAFFTHFGVILRPGGHQ